MPRLIPPVVALALVLAAPASAVEKATERDRSRLWNDCRPVDVIVVGLSDDAGKIGLRRKTLETAVRSRLRGARIYDGIPPAREPRWIGWKVDHVRYGEPFLYLDVNVVGVAFGVEVGFRRSVMMLLPVPDGMDPLVGPATTWASGSTGTHGGNSSYVLSAVTELVDEFIDEYLRVNWDACEKLPPAQ